MASTSSLRQALTARGASLHFKAGSRGRRVPSASLQPVSIAQVRHSHIGKAAIQVAPTTEISILPFAPVVNPSRRQPAALIKARSIRVRGPLGTVLVPLQHYVNVAWDLGKGKTRALAEAASNAGGSATAAAASSTPDELQRLTLSVADRANREQRAIWGLTRALLANAVEGVQEGHWAVLRLVGVGYRAAVETDPFPRPDKFDIAFDPAQAGMPASADANFSSPAQIAYYAEVIKASAASERKRLTVRLGFSHPINFNIPRGLTVTTPTPTRIIVKGTDKEQIGLFAAEIRKHRPPEPYKGKGVFVNDETIRLKSPRKK